MRKMAFNETGDTVMAFEDGLGEDTSQPTEQTQEFTANAYEIVSRTINLWIRKIIQYVTIVGVARVVVLLVSGFVLFTVLGITGIISQDLFNYIFGLFSLTTPPDTTLIILTVLFASILIIVNALVGGAAIKFTLDEYGYNNGDISTSFSHSSHRFISLITVQVLLTFITAAALVPSATLATSALDMIDISDPFNPVFPPGSVELLLGAFAAMALGFLVVIYIQIRFAPTLAILMDSDLSVIDSLKKSWRITSGNFWHIFGAQILIGVAVFVINLVITFCAEFAFLTSSYYASLAGNILSALFVSAVNFIYTAVLYRDLSSRSDISEYPGYIQ